MEIESIMQDEKYTKLFAYYDSSVGINPIIKKLPINIQEKWTNEANKYKQRHSVVYPPFSVFAMFVNNIERSATIPASFMTLPIMHSRVMDISALEGQVLPRHRYLLGKQM